MVDMGKARHGPLALGGMMRRRLRLLLRRLWRFITRWKPAEEGGVAKTGVLQAPTSVKPQDLSKGALAERFRMARLRSTKKPKKRRQRDIDAEKLRAIKERFRAKEDRHEAERSEAHRGEG